MSCLWAHFLMGSHTLCLHSGIVSPLRLCWVKGVCVFRCNLPHALFAEWLGSRMHAYLGATCHVHFLQNDLGLLFVTAVMQGWNRHRISQNTMLTLDKKILLQLLPQCQDSNLQTFSRESGIPPTSYPGSLNLYVFLKYGTRIDEHCS